MSGAARHQNLFRRLKNSKIARLDPLLNYMWHPEAAPLQQGSRHCLRRTPKDT